MVNGCSGWREHMKIQEECRQKGESTLKYLGQFFTPKTHSSIRNQLKQPFSKWTTEHKMLGQGYFVTCLFKNRITAFRIHETPLPCSKFKFVPCISLNYCFGPVGVCGKGSLLAWGGEADGQCPIILLQGPFPAFHSLCCVKPPPPHTRAIPTPPPCCPDKAHVVLS